MSTVPLGADLDVARLTPPEHAQDALLRDDVDARDILDLPDHEVTDFLDLLEGDVDGLLEDLGDALPVDLHDVLQDELLRGETEETSPDLRLDEFEHERLDWLVRTALGDGLGDEV